MKVPIPTRNDVQLYLLLPLRSCQEIQLAFSESDEDENQAKLLDIVN